MNKALIMYIFVALVSLPGALAGCAANAPARQVPAANADTPSTIVVLSDSGHYRLRLIANALPVPLDSIHSWTLHLEDINGALVEDARIKVYGGMPAHRHGFPTHPRVTGNLGKGDYLVDGVKFNMPGEWELWFDFTTSTRRDKAIFRLNIG